MRTNGYATTIIDISVIQSIFLSRWVDVFDLYNMNLGENETVYDWCVTKAFYRVVNIRFGVLRPDIDIMSGDLYDIIYQTHFGNEFEEILDDILMTWNITVEPGQSVKIMVTGDNLYISRRNPSVKV